MNIKVFKKLGTKEQYQYIRDLDYQPSNLPNVGVHYGDIRSICIERGSSAYISEGTMHCFHNQPQNKVIQHDVPINQPTELKNETTRRMYVKLEDCMLLDEKQGDYTYTFRSGVDPDLKKILDN